MLFVVDSMEDDAVLYIRKLMEAHPEKDIRIVCSGKAKNCSQKVHNMLAGFKEASPLSEFAVVLDSDIEIHCRAMADMVETQRKTGAFAVTGKI